MLLRQEGEQAGSTGYDGEDDTQLSFAERALQRKRIQEKTECSKYVNTNFLLPSLCMVERLFSKAKRVFSPYRRCLHTKTLEALQILKQKESFGIWQ